MPFRLSGLLCRFLKKSHETLSFTLQISGPQHSMSIYLPLLHEFLYLLIKVSNFIFKHHTCLFRSHRPTDKETTEEPRCGCVERLSNSKQRTKHKNSYNQFDSFASVSYGLSTQNSTADFKEKSAQRRSGG